MQAVLRAAWDIDSSAKIIAIAECDYRRTDAEEKFDFWYRKQCWAVIRHKLHEGRAMKVFIAKELEGNISCLTWLRRSVVIKLKSDRDDVTIVASSPMETLGKTACLKLLSTYKIRNLARSLWAT